MLLKFILLIFVDIGTAQKFVITKLDIKTDVKYRFAETFYTLSVFNPSQQNQTYIVDIPFPKDAFITNLTIETKDAFIVSDVTDKSAIDNSKTCVPKHNHVSSTQLTETSSFLMPINVPAEEEVTVSLAYQEVLRRLGGVYTIRTIIGNCKNGYNINFNMSITEIKTLTNLRMVPFWKDIHQGNVKDLALHRPSNNTAVITYHAVSGKSKCLQKLHLEYDVERSPNAGEILIEDGFFVHFLAPTGLQAIPKDIVFVLDASESMAGEPMAELQSAMDSILDKLKLRDRFNIIVFRSSFGLLESELQNVTTETILNAKNMMNYQTPGGGTNIYDGLLAGVKMLHSIVVKEIRSPIIIFLTDGKASSGITNNNIISSRVKSWNVLGIPIFSISLGKYADQKLTEKIANQNFGSTLHVLDPATSSSLINNLYDEVATTLLKHINVVYSGNLIDNTTLSQTRFGTLFNQSEIVISGKLVNESNQLMESTVIGLGVSGVTVLSNASVSVIDGDRDKNTLEAIWQHRRAKDVMRAINVVDDPRLVDALNNTLLAMSLKNNYVTPVTAILVGQDGHIYGSSIVNNDERVSYASAYKTNATTIKNRNRVSRFSGKGDPHFEISVKGVEYPICFDVITRPGVILRILQSQSKIVLNVGIIPETNHYRINKQYISDIFASVEGETILLNIHSGIFYKNKKYGWSHEYCTLTRVNRLTMCSNNNSNIVEFQLTNKVYLKVHRVIHPDTMYFNFYIENFFDLPSDSTGLLGNLLHRKIAVKHVFAKHNSVIGSFVCNAFGSKNNTHFTAKLKPNQRSKSEDLCWHVHKVETFIGNTDNFEFQSLFHSY